MKAHTKIWPDTVPILTAKNLCRGSIGFGEKCCQLGWVWHAFSGRTKWAVEDMLLAVIREDYPLASTIPQHNDDRRVPQRQLAAEWNETMKRLGYTEVFEID